MSTTTTAPEINSLKSRQKETWMALDYDRFSRYMEQGARIFYEQLNVPAGCQLLDVACGSGQVALWAALDGVNVTGVDIAPTLVQRAQAVPMRKLSRLVSLKVTPRRFRLKMPVSMS
jgi:2-polyprenyl-3-methyl-5-hydroxy-6-metoxy-1,4-benzoquinol methylase